MKKYRLIILYIPVLLLLAACSSEDELSPSNIQNNYFAPDKNATDEESMLRKDFHNSEKCYLLFNDTLRHDSIGVTPNNDVQYFTETVDVGYTMTGILSFKYSYLYLTTMDQKKQAANFVKEKLLSHLSTKLRPFSWLLVKNITEYETSDIPYSYQGEKSFVAGKRCIAIATENLSDLSEDELKEFATSLFIELIIEKMKAQSAATMKAFTKYSASLYDNYTKEIPIDEEANMKALNEDGFIEAAYLWGSPWLGKYPNFQSDLSAFVKLVLTTSEEDVNATYSEYPVVISKYDVLKNMITELGYTF